MDREIEINAANMKEIDIRSSILPGFEFDFYLTNRSEHQLLKPLFDFHLNIYGTEVASKIVFLKGAWNESNQEHANFKVFLTREILQGIEKRRTDDLPIGISMDCYCFIREEKINVLVPKRFMLQKDMKHSQKEWLNRLKNMGYKESWIIEMERPSIEGLDSVNEHLVNANNKIQARNFEDALGECRIAWNCLTPIIDGFKEKIGNEIDRNSEGEERFPNKSKRIKELMDKILQLSQIGIHRESYAVTPEDALLCYRTTIAMMSYLSNILGKIER